MRLLIFVACAVSLQAQPDRVAAALKDRAIADAASRLKTDERVAMYELLVKTKPEELHYQNLLASAFLQKTRETTDFSYLERADKILFNVLAADGRDYEALRLRSLVELERHNFTRVAEYSKQLTALAPDDPWNWGTLGDALMELGKYEEAADAYQKMVTLRPDLASYNRASFYRFIAGDLEGAIEVMKRAIEAGSRSPENVAWCLVDLGNLYSKSSRLVEAERAYTAALRTFPGYHPALAGLGHVQKEQGNLAAAVESYKRAEASTPMPEYAAALADLYAALGKPQESARQMEMVDVIEKMGRANQEKANRTLALIYADHDRKLDRALELAQAELSVRGDVYTYDALAWVLYKNKRYAEAEQAMKKALKMSTPEPMFHYHAGLIRKALEKAND